MDTSGTSASAIEINDESYLAALCRAVPYHIVERVLVDPTEAALEARSLDGCVLSADLVGFTSLADRLAVEDASALSSISSLLDRLFTAMQLDAFFPYGGRITEFGGDAVTVVFWGEEHARRAVTSALQILDTLAREVRGAERDDVRALQLRVGIAAGQVQLAVLGDLTRRVSFCSGEATHRAIVLQSQARPGRALVGAEIAQALGPELSGQVLESGDVLVDALARPSPRAGFEYLGDRVKGRTVEKIRMLEPFVPAPLARRLRTTPNGWRLEPEMRRDVVVAFADITGFLSGDVARYGLSFDLARSILRAFQRHDGLLLKATAIERGHRVMVLFGAHRLDGNECERAALAALDALARFRGYLSAVTGELSMRVGLHRGSIFFGGVGGRSKHDLTALGDTVNVAARVTAAAAPLGVFATRAVAAEVAHIFTISERGEVLMKGKPEPVELVEFHGVKGGRAHYAQRRAKRRGSVGREDTEALIDGALVGARNGVARTLALCGAPGTGKSHTVSNICDRWIELGGEGLVSRCLYAHRTMPLAPIRDLFDAYLRVSGSEPEAVRATRIRDALDAVGLAQNHALLSFLQPVRRPDGQDEAVLDLADPETADRLISGIARLIERRAELRPLLIAIEDLHYADSLTLRVVESLDQLRRDRPFFILVTARHEARLESICRRFDMQIDLDPLTRTAIVELIRHQTGGRDVDSELLGFLWERGQGNPEHLIETLRFLSERQLVRRSDDDLIAPIVALADLAEIVPPTWAQMAVTRMDGATEIERHVLRTASAIGRTFPTEVLTEVEHDLPLDVVESSLLGLESQHWLAPEQAGRASYRFRDEVSQAVAYSIIPEGERRGLHRRIAAALERVLPSRGYLLPALAHHQERVGELERALGLWETAVERARASGNTAEVDRLAARLRDLRSRLRR